MQSVRPLRRVLGLGFGLAMAFGGTVGVGILRLPAMLAATLGDSRLIVLFWILGGVYALLGAVTVAELAAMLPEAGGFYVYARRAFGNGAGFVVGWSDCFNQIAALSYNVLAAAAFVGELWPAADRAPRTVAIGIIAAFTLLHWVGLSIGSTLTRLISVSVGATLMILVVGCFIVAPDTSTVAAAPLIGSAVTLPFLSVAMLGAGVAALRSVFVAYDGWYSPIYMSEESTQPTLTIPRAMIGGTLVVAAFYVIINVAILRVLPLSVIASSPLPAAEAAKLVMPHGGAALVTLISLLTVLSLSNATLLMAPRIMLAIGRDGLFTRKAAEVSAGGTPRLALAVTSLGSIAMIMSGTFDEVVAVAAVLFLLNYVSAYVAALVLRRREPALARPYKAAGFPWTTMIVLIGCLALWIAIVLEDIPAGEYAAVLLLACVPVYLWLSRRMRSHFASK